MLKVSVSVQLKFSVVTPCKFNYMSDTQNSITVFETITMGMVKCFKVMFLKSVVNYAESHLIV
jgi:hypothetical protein